MELIDKARFDEVCSALGRDQFAMLIDLFLPSYQEERDRLVAAAQDGDRESVYRAAHTIKGMAANMAATQLAEYARALELYDGPLDDALADKVAELDRLTDQTISQMRDFLN
ncbi:Hpt domain-containing protein [Thalassospira sp. MA62]|nr:Hpt domain-containing protein [Thalassospira sp. MA62]